MATIFVTYTGSRGSRFDRDYYVAHHIPLVMATWGPLGLLSAEALFPAAGATPPASGEGVGLIALCACVFRDEAAIAAAFGSPRTEAVMADVKQFTDVEPARSRAVPV